MISVSAGPRHRLDQVNREGEGERAAPSRRAVTHVLSEGRGREDGATRAGARVERDSSGRAETDSVGCSGDLPEADDHRRDRVHDTGVDGADGPCARPDDPRR